MAFLRFTRDRRGYEHFYLIQPTNRRGSARPRLLYWFRTPPNIKVGRQPFDPEIRRALEARYPEVSFDWKAIVDTPIPPVVDTERWRERRRVERVLREEAGAESDGPAGEPAGVSVVSANAVVEAAAPQPLMSARAGEAVAVHAEAPNVADGPAPTSDFSSGQREAGQPNRGRRRRRRGARGKRSPQDEQQGQRLDADPEGAQHVDVQDSGEPENPD